MEGQRLCVSQRDGTPGPFLEHAVRAEVVEAHARGGDECASAPAPGKLQLAGRLLGDVVDDVHRVVELVRDYVVSAFPHDGLGVELAEGSYFTDGPLEVGLAEQITRTGEDLPADDLFVGEVVAVDYYVVEGCLLAFGYAHLHIDRVVLDVGFHRGELEEEVAVVAV